MRSKSKAIAIKGKTQPQMFEICLPEEEEQIQDERIMEFLRCVMAGYPFRIALKIAGIPYTTMQQWLNPNHKSYREQLFKLFERAQGLSVGKQIDKINASIDWRAAAFWLERNVQEFAPKSGGDKSINVTEEESKGLLMTPEACKELSDAYDKRKKETK